VRTIVSLWTFCALGVACSSQSPSPPSAPGRTDPAAVHVEGNTFRDGQGRQLLFRGYNTKVNGIFDVTFDDGRIPNYTFPSFDEAGAKKFEELGFDAMRLTINWSALEPHPKEYAQSFFDKVEAVLAMAKAHHFYVILDMHQDGYSKEIGEDGAPLWAIVPPPDKLLQGPSDDSRRTTAVCLNAGFSFFDNVPATDGRPLQEAFIQAVEQMARKWSLRPEVLGFEDFNEPIVLNPTELRDFHERFADRVHAIDKDAPILFEPAATRNQTDQAALPADPWSHGPGVYAVHIYTGQFSIPSQNGWQSEDPTVLAPSMEAAGREATAWQTPMFVTEFDCDQSIPRGPKWLSAELDLQDKQLTSSTIWAWEPGSWGIRDDQLNYRPDTVRVVSRAYPRAVAGDLLSIEHPANGQLLVRYRATARTKGLPHEVSASSDWVKDYKISCDGVDVPYQADIGRATFTCPWSPGEHSFLLAGTPQ
jgi:hypothetical protein